MMPSAGDMTEDPAGLLEQNIKRPEWSERNFCLILIAYAAGVVLYAAVV